MRPPTVQTAVACTTVTHCRQIDECTAPARKGRIANRGGGAPEALRASPPRQRGPYRLPLTLQRSARHRTRRPSVAAVTHLALRARAHMVRPRRRHCTAAGKHQTLHALAHTSSPPLKTSGVRAARATLAFATSKAFCGCTACAAIPSCRAASGRYAADAHHARAHYGGLGPRLRQTSATALGSRSHGKTLYSCRLRLRMHTAPP